MNTEQYRIRLENLFEGPMDLLVHLIKKNELDIYDIPIALVTEQYLQYLEWMKSMNIEFAGEFIVMASTLTQIKSRMLLPSHGAEDDEEDPRMEIARPLLEYLQLKSAAEQLVERNLLGENTFVRHPKSEAFLTNDDDEVIKIGLFELIDAFQKILEKIPDDQQLEFAGEGLSVRERITAIADILEAKGSITFSELFSENPAKQEVIVTFLALLEMVKLTVIKIVQHIQTGIIRIFYL